jgi:hypothetical protein
MGSLDLEFVPRWKAGRQRQGESVPLSLFTSFADAPFTRSDSMHATRILEDPRGLAQMLILMESLRTADLTTVLLSLILSPRNPCRSR